MEYIREVSIMKGTRTMQYSEIKDPKKYKRILVISIPGIAEIIATLHVVVHVVKTFIREVNTQSLFTIKNMHFI